MRTSPGLSPYCQMWKCPERGRKQPRVTQPYSGRAGTWTSVSSAAFCFLPSVLAHTKWSQKPAGYSCGSNHCLLWDEFHVVWFLRFWAVHWTLLPLTCFWKQELCSRTTCWHHGIKSPRNKKRWAERELGQLKKKRRQEPKIKKTNEPTFWNIYSCQALC